VPIVERGSPAEDATSTLACEADRLRFLSLEILGRCQLRCLHGYADSGPWGTHGTMTTQDWRRLLEEAAAMGVGRVQLIGGEPTLHPDLPELVGHALGVGVEVSSKPGPPPPGAAVGGLGAAEGRARHLVPRGRCGATG
jgi:hypothetical protein